MALNPDNISDQPRTPEEAQKSFKHSQRAVPIEDEIIELAWADEVGRIDEAIAEIRRLCDSDEITPDEIASALAHEPAITSDLPEAAIINSPSAPARISPSSAVPLKYKVRAKSRTELGHLWKNTFCAVDEIPPGNIIVTGAQRGEGATQIATGLAMIGAESNRESRVALVDFNIRNPQIADLLRLKHQPGLTDVLNGQVTLESAMQVVSLRNGNRLDVLTGGTVSVHPLGLLNSRQARGLIATLKQWFDHVIIDVANAQTFPDAQVLGPLVDGAVMVVKAANTLRETASEAKKKLDLAGVRCLGLVLNQRSDPIPRRLYQTT